MKRCGIICGCLVLFVLTGAQVAEGALFVFDVFRSTSSIVMRDGVIEDFQDAASAGGAGSLASFGDLLTHGARSAGRSTMDEIAANAQFFDSTFTGGHRYLAGSGAQAKLGVRNVFGAPTDVVFDFFLPPTQLKLTTNSELAPTHVLEARALAQIEINFTSSSGAPLNGSAEFGFEVELASNHDDMPTVTPGISAGYRVSVEGEPDPLNTMDVTPLLFPTIQRSDVNGVRTVTVDFPQFFGRLNLGEVSGLPRDAIIVDYQIGAEVTGIALNTEAIAAINDPFALSTDPVIPGVPIFPQGNVIVPEPTSAIMMLGLTLTIAARRRRRGII